MRVIDEANQERVGSGVFNSELAGAARKSKYIVGFARSAVFTQILHAFPIPEECLR
ncbi:hypothetical protein D3C76_1731550 [compost metagenome]